MARQTVPGGRPPPSPPNSHPGQRTVGHGQIKSSRRQSARTAGPFTPLRGLGGSALGAALHAQPGVGIRELLPRQGGRSQGLQGLRRGRDLSQCHDLSVNMPAGVGIGGSQGSGGTPGSEHLGPGPGPPDLSANPKPTPTQGPQVCSLHTRTPRPAARTPSGTTPYRGGTGALTNGGVARLGKASSIRT